MGFLYTPLPFWIAVGGWIAAVGLLVLALWKRPIGRLQDATLQHVWLALVTTITVLWASNAWRDDGLVMHLLGATMPTAIAGDTKPWPTMSAGRLCGSHASAARCSSVDTATGNAP